MGRKTPSGEPEERMPSRPLMSIMTCGTENGVLPTICGELSEANIIVNIKNFQLDFINT